MRKIHIISVYLRHHFKNSLILNYDAITIITLKKTISFKSPTKKIEKVWWLTKNFKNVPTKKKLNYPEKKKTIEKIYF